MKYLFFKVGDIEFRATVTLAGGGLRTIYYKTGPYRSWRRLKWEWARELWGNVHFKIGDKICG